MKILRHSIAAFLLVLTLTNSLCAGVMSTPIAPPNPTPTPTAEGASTTNVDGVMSTPNAETAAAGDSAAAAALSLVQSLLALL